MEQLRGKNHIQWNWEKNKSIFHKNTLNVHTSRVITVLLGYVATSVPKHKTLFFSRYRYVHIRHFYFVDNLVINKTTDPTQKKRPSFCSWHHSRHKFSRHRAAQFFNTGWLISKQATSRPIFKHATTWTCQNNSKRDEQSGYNIWVLAFGGLKGYVSGMLMSRMKVPPRKSTEKAMINTH